MNFMFEWQEQSGISCHENIKFISLSQRVMFFLLYVACSAGVFLKLGIVNSPPYWNSRPYWLVGKSGLVTCSFSLTPTPWDAFSSLPKPRPSLNPRWRSLDQSTRSRPRQNTPALQAILYGEINSTKAKAGNRDVIERYDNHKNTPLGSRMKWRMESTSGLVPSKTLF